MGREGWAVAGLTARLTAPALTARPTARLDPSSDRPTGAARSRARPARRAKFGQAVFYSTDNVPQSGGRH